MGIKTRVYPHFDHVIKHESEARKLIKNFQETGIHSFLPFLEYDLEHRRFAKYLEYKRLLEAGKDASGVKVKKSRPIKYASHKDSQIFSYYRAILSIEYENKLADCGLTDNVIAYRKIPTKENPEKGKCNIHFAKEAFDEIVKRGNAKVITMDVKGFFESLDHAFLYKKWCQLLRVEDLPKDHRSVFSAITNYSVVNHRNCFEKLGFIRINGNKKQFLHCPLYLFKHKKKLCSSEEFRTKIVNAGLVKKNDYKGEKIPQGIPQGSPISDLLANMYMLDFDIAMKAMAEAKGAYYRRYSDDILWICEPADADFIKDAAQECIKLQGDGTLKIGEEKTTSTDFAKDGDILSYSGNSFSYLGFSFDGKKALYRQKTISNFKRDVIHSIKPFVRKAHEKGEGNKQKKIKGNGRSLKNNLNVSQIYHTVAYLNKDYIKDKTDEKRQNPVKNKKRVESNFMTYHLRAMRIFNQQPNNAYKLSDHQLLNHKTFVRDKIVQAARKYDSSFTL